MPRSRKRRSGAIPGAVLVLGLGLGLGLGAGAAAGQGAGAVIWCHDTERDVVAKMVNGHCAGVRVDAATAAAIKARRAERLKRAFQNPDKQANRRKRRLFGVGSGFFVGRSGAVITNHHVIRECKSVSVAATTGQEAEAKVRATDPANDLALLETGMTAPAVARFAPAPITPDGRRVALVGYPTQGMPPRTPFFTPGQTIGDDFAHIRPQLFQMRAEIRSGNSGGPVLDDRGHVVGVVAARLDTVAAFEKRGETLPYIGIAIRPAVVFRLLRKSGVAYETAAPGAATLSEDQVFAVAKPFVARINCWK